MESKYVRHMGRRERLYRWLAIYFDNKQEALSEKAWEKHHAKFGKNEHQRAV